MSPTITAAHWILSACLTTFPVLVKDPSWVGKLVITKTADVELGMRVEDKKWKVIGVVKDAFVTVEETDGKWIKVRTSNAIGWIAKADAVRLEDAVAYFTDRIKKNPKDAEAHSLRAAVWQETGELDKALKDHSEAIRLKPDEAAYYNNRGATFYAKKDYDKALKDFDEAVRLDPKYPGSHVNRGNVHLVKRDYRKALDAYSEAIRLDPKLAQAYAFRGDVYQANEEYAKAIDEYGVSIKLNPADPWPYFGRGNCHYSTNDFAVAVDDFGKAIRLNPRFLDAFYQRGKANLRKQDYAKALQDFDEVIRIDPKFDVVYNTRAWLWATCPDAKYRDGKKAVESAKRACELTDWKVPYHLDTLAAAYAEAGEFDEAVKMQKKALEFPVSDEEHAKRARERLKLYEERKPYREEKR